MQVHVYTSYPEVRLMLNGKNIGEQNVSEATKLTATFNINYEPGELKAIAVKNGVAIDSVILQTAGKPARIRLVADRSVIHANKNDLSYVTAEVLDAKGNVVPDADVPLHFTVEGAGKIIATGNANPSDMESFQQPQHKTFRGKALVIVKPKGKAGSIKLKANGKGLKSGEIVIQTK
jgi:beta-galactosidase